MLSLLPLFFFKYYDYFTEFFELKDLHIGFILPLGLSFYTFSMIGFYVDTYKGKNLKEQNFTEILLFIAFWPHLASGPILRIQNIFTETKEKLTQKNCVLISVLLLTGLIKKFLIADNIGAYVNWNIDYGIKTMNVFDAWSTMLGFSVQIYVDFSGYSDMAIAFALALGYKLPANFNYPYRASSLTDFWRRWHISLSTWFRDYVYYPLGGNKQGKYRGYFNILIVFILSGIWHGFGLGFAIWGAIHGIMLILEKVFSKYFFRIPAALRWLWTLMLVTVAWVFFRLKFSSALILVKKMFLLEGGLLFEAKNPFYNLSIFLVLIFFIIEHICRFYKVDPNGYVTLNHQKHNYIILGILTFIALTFSGSQLPFIYFDF